MDLKLEVVLLPVKDVDRAKAFYTDKAGFNLDVDHRAGEDFRVVQLTPPGSACSVTIGVGITDAAPGSYRGTHLIVTDIEAASDELSGRGVEVSAIRHMGCGRLGARPGSRAPRLRLLRRLQRPGRQHLGPPGARAQPGRQERGMTRWGT